ncbi:MAG: hypothetical protein A2Z04_05625 [Chloroflexi bacterium RBG_16_57_9]|nr:MAG: hypothetical protein A2Z04_05625 [Chloroflexi bacterium RBG_16_57_9]
MPIYQYECSQCHYSFERMQSYRSDPVRECPECNGLVRRLISPVGVIFKGSGFYITDNRQVSSGSKPKEISPPKSDNGAAETTKAPSSETAD